MNTDPRIEAAAKALNTAGWTCHEGNEEPGEYDRCADCKRHCDELATAALAAADAANLITTQEQLAATPAGTVFIDSYQVHLGGDVYQKSMELNGRGELIPAYWQAGPQGVFTNIKLPARVLHWDTP